MVGRPKSEYLLKSIGVRLDPEMWNQMTEKAKRVGLSKNALTNMVLKRVIQMDKDDILRFIYPTALGPLQLDGSASR